MAPTVEYGLDAVLNVFDEQDDPHEPLTAGDVAEALGCARRTAYTKLQSLREQDVLRSKKTGAKGRVWWKPADRSVVPADLIELMPAAVTLVDDEGRVVRANARAAELVGMAPADYVETSLRSPPWELIDEHGEASGHEDSPIRRAIDEGEATTESVHSIVRSDGTRRWIVQTVAPLEDAQAETLRVMITAHDITSLKNLELASQRQRQQLERLDRLNRVIRAVNRRLLDATDRESLEEQVCVELAGFESYQTVSIIRSAHQGRRTPVATAGEVEHQATYEQTEWADRLASVLDAMTDMREAYVDASSDPDQTPNIAAVPIVHDEAQYGMMFLTSSDSDAFIGDELYILEELGATIGHGISAVQRMRALTEDTVVKLVFEGELDIFRVIMDLDDTNADAEIQRTIPLDDGSTLSYIRVSGVECEDVLRALDGLSTVGRVTPVEQGDRYCTLEVQSEGRTAEAVFAKFGGRITRAYTANDAARLIAEVPHGTELREIINAVQDQYPSFQLIGRQTIEREDDEIADVLRSATAELTDRQETAIELAYHSGFFDWPRGATGEELAETMGVAPSTFHRHLRVGERKVFATILEHASTP